MTYRSNLNETEERELEHILDEYVYNSLDYSTSLLSAEFVSDREDCRWSKESTKRKVKVEPEPVGLLLCNDE